MDKTIDTASREIRSWQHSRPPAHCPPAGDWSPRRRCSSAELGTGFGAVRRAAWRCHRGRVLRRPPHPRAATRGELCRGWRRGERPRAPPAPADAERRLRDRRRSHFPGHVFFPVTTPYYREKHARRAKRRPGLYPALVVLSIYDRCALEAEPRMQAAPSPCTARWPKRRSQLRSDGIALDIKTLRSTAYRYAARARAAQQSLSVRSAGPRDRRSRRSSPSTGAASASRRKKRGEQHDRRRATDSIPAWKEPKLLILYVVGDDVRPSQTWAPINDGTLRGPEAVFALLLSYAAADRPQRR